MSIYQEVTTRWDGYLFHYLFSFLQLQPHYLFIYILCMWGDGLAQAFVYSSSIIFWGACTVLRLDAKKHCRGWLCKCLVDHESSRGGIYASKIQKLFKINTSNVFGSLSLKNTRPYKGGRLKNFRLSIGLMCVDVFICAYVICCIEITLKYGHIIKRNTQILFIESIGI